LNPLNRFTPSAIATTGNAKPISTHNFPNIVITELPRLFDSCPGHPSARKAEHYSTGNLRTVYFWPEQLKGHTERVYRPGE
jgi:hypothetical protein